MIPSFNASMVLPPFIGADPTTRAGMSPYKVTMLQIVERFAISPDRIAILNGLISYRAALVAAGIKIGFQWLDGSFVENVEVSRKRPPKDIDIVSIAHRPKFLDPAQDQQWFNQHSNLFDPDYTSNNFHCDAYFIDLGKRPDLIVDDTRYWFGLFSHQRETSLWKGMLQVNIDADDTDAMLKLNELAQQGAINA
ncbi:DUF6932 family protein [Undibacterium sp. SXout11W]|uniref:DUF6932 family protein n=1 Tax=Undibacterium sp. SXout11W TaxID=3413050 RepID=UPI003BF0E260